MTTRSILRTASSAMVAALTFLAACSDATVAPAPQAPAVHEVSVTPASHFLITGQHATLQAEARASNGEKLDRPVVWTSENENLATVSPAGVVTAVAVGEVAIRASSEGRIGRGVLTILPKPPVTVAEVRISADAEIVLPWNGTTTISATPFDADSNAIEGRTTHWMSSRPTVATISDSGHIVAKSAGTAIITAVIDGMLSHVGVRVLEAPVTDLTIDAETYGLEVGETFYFAARITRANGSVFYAPTQWTSSATSVASVTHIDLWYAAIEAVAEGEATLTATFDGKSASKTVRVAARPTHDLIYTNHTGSAAEIYVLGLGLNTNHPVPTRLNA